MDNNEHKHGHDHHDHHHGHNYWASWCSPVGLGIFFATAAIGAAVAVYTILSLITGIMSLAHPAASSYSYPSEAAYPTDATTGMGTDATGAAAQ